jgi:hypothetical protein
MAWTFDDERDVPFFGSERDAQQLEALVSNCLSVLREAKRVREMVLETWLTVDYAVRGFLLAGFELARFCDDGFDLRYKLLPREFSGLLNLLEFTIRFNSALPTEPDPLKPDTTGGFTSSLEYWRFVEEHFPDLRARMEEARRQYIIAKNPELSSTDLHSGAFFIPNSKPAITRIGRGWLQVAAALDDGWFKLARQLNDARNVAAHSFRQEEIGKRLGLTGPSLLPQTREKCLHLLSTLLAVRIEAPTDQPCS